MIETYNGAKDDPELLGLLMLFGATERIIDTFDVKGGEIFGIAGVEPVARPSSALQASSIPPTPMASRAGDPDPETNAGARPSRPAMAR